MTSRTGSKPSRSSRARLGGFTLVELILVMALLTVVGSLGAPTLARFFRGRSLDSEARRFLSLTRYGQSRAVSEGVPMVLWIDADQGVYGLGAEPGYLADDPKAVQFVLNEDLAVEIEQTRPLPIPDRPGRTASRQADRRPEIRFTPDGFIDDTSPDAVLIREGEERRLWVGQSRNRLHYEIQTNRLELAWR
jgi:prepilin-type N-terminal cleavage/methylation domain-containing protein